jgi:hypothetical protein
MTLATFTNQKNRPIRVRLRADQPAGIAHEGRDYYPGDELEVSFALAARLIGNGRASLVNPDDRLTPAGVVEARDPVVATTRTRSR